MILNITLGVIALVGWVCCYVNAHRLKQWSNFCKHGRIFIAYNGKIKHQAPMTEWVLWAKQLDKDKYSKGRPIYQMRGTTIGISKAVVPPKVKRKFLPDRKPSQQKAEPHVVKEGKYKTTDETPRVTG